MVFKLTRRKVKSKRKYNWRKNKVTTKSQYRKASQTSQKPEMKTSQSLEINDTNRILARLDVIMGYLREHHSVIKNQIEASHSDLKAELFTLGAAKKILKETKLDKIVQEKLSRGETKSQIVRQLIDAGACSRATAYRVIGKNEEFRTSQNLIFCLRKNETKTITI